MSTGSIRHNIEITDSTDAERFVEALEKAKAESEEGMERKEIIDGLKDLIKDRESFITEGEPESWKTDTDKIFEHDKQVLEEAINTIEAQQQEIEQLQAQLDEWKYEANWGYTTCHMDEVIAREKQIEQLQAQAARMWEALRKAREALITTIKGIDNKKIIPANADAAIELWRHKQQISNALAAIDKAIGGVSDGH